ncbi:H-NS family nucleoid-associated regulatory protein [Paraburkholderia sp. BR13439]|uniref:H-NS family nucleoid-associated regulatory protein n=1 Tax=unclassified Paraburkholderia TaxID=2615204 RepID=UPI0034CEFADA
MATTLEAIQAKMKKLQAQADALATRETAKVLKVIRELMEKHGLTAADIDGHAGGKQRATKGSAKPVGKKSVTAAKYRNPKTGATWTGHGRAPSWIATAKSRDKFLVDGGTMTIMPTTATKAKTVVKKTSKTIAQRIGKGQPKGPQPALYRDPKSGATWSGRGRAPAWLASVKDRSKFLIAGGSTVADAKPAVTKAISKKAPTAKKTATRKAESAKVPAKKAPTKKAPRQSITMPAPVVTVESDAELMA